MMISPQNQDDRRNEIIRIKQNIEALKSSGHFNEQEQADLLPRYESRLKDLENKQLLDITVNDPEIVKY